MDIMVVVGSITDTPVWLVCNMCTGPLRADANGDLICEACGFFHAGEVALNYEYGMSRNLPVTWEVSWLL